MLEQAKIGLEILIQYNLEEIRQASIRKEGNLYKFTRKYFEVINVAKNYLPEKTIQKYEKEYLDMYYARSKDTD